jgi:hypothetical protein
MKVRFKRRGDNPMAKAIGVVKSVMSVGIGLLLGILAGILAGIFLGLGIAKVIGVV